MNIINRLIAKCIVGYNTKNHVKIFKNTLYWINNDSTLMANVAKSISRQEIIKENDKLAGDIITRDKQCQIKITKNKTFEAARNYSLPKVCVLNFASATSPGGGVVISKGPSGQEECLCRASTLYKCINTEYVLKQFYIQQKNGNNLHNDDIIYTPNVVVFKDDDNNLMDKKQWFSVDVISCAAPNIGKYQKGESHTTSIDAIELMHIHEKRARRILDVAVHHNVDVLILGAFGCGAFGNPPDIVAEAYKKVIVDYYNCFNDIEFAIYCQNNEYNYQTFKHILI